MNTKKVAIACGGTGGHLFPGLAVAEELRRRGHEVLLLVSPKQIDVQALETAKDYDHRVLPAIGWPGISLKIMAFGWKFLQARWDCGRLFRTWKPDAVLGMGGFTSAVPLMLAARRRIPSLLHESNAIPGKVTRYLASRVRRVLLGFAQCASRLPGAVKSTITGTPIRSTLKCEGRQRAYQMFDLNPDFKTILIMGGSQGARGINELVIQAMPLWQKRQNEWQFLHLTGTEDISLIEYNYRREKLRAKVIDFCSEMGAAYSIADLAISRSGAASITELLFAGIASILIPYPFAAENHQYYNAQVVADAGAGLILDQVKTSPAILAETVSSLLDNPSRLNAMKKAASELSHTNATALVADAVEEEMRS